MSKDSRGVLRGKCTVCSCDGYSGGAKGLKCDRSSCSHPPGKHEKLDPGAASAPVASPSTPQQSQSSDQPTTAPPSKPKPFPIYPQPPSVSSDGPLHFTVGDECQVQGCTGSAYTDLNTAEEYPLCRQHLSSLPEKVRNMYISSATDDYGDDDIASDSSLSHLYPQPQIHTTSYSPRTHKLKKPHRSASPHLVASLRSPPHPHSQLVPPDSDNDPQPAGWFNLVSNYFRPRSAHPGLANPPSISPQGSVPQPQPVPSSSPLVFRPRTAQPRPANPPSISRQDVPQPGPVPSSSPLVSSQSTPVLAPTSSPSRRPQTAQAPSQPLVPPDQQCKLPGCTARKFVEPSGRVHDYCRRKHYYEFMELQQGSGPVSPDMKCSTPGCPWPKRQKDNGSGYFDFCSMTCRNRGQMGVSASMPELGTSEQNTCKLTGCNRAKYMDSANGRVHDFCSRSHAFEANRQGIVVENISIRTADGQEFQAVSAKFTGKWDTRKGPCPDLSFVFVVKNTTLEKRWTTYRQGLNNKTVEEYYHGTKLTCDITTLQALCTNEDCGVCGISRVGLDRRCIQKNIPYQRFGHGFYLAPNSSKCHDYTQGYGNYRAMLLCDVVPGNKYQLTRGDEKLTSPPQGFDSVYGKSGQDLNYDEIVVYQPDCVMPRYVVVYQKDGIVKIAK